MEEDHAHRLSSTVDTSRPFTSVKEAVAIFGERLLVGELSSAPKPFFSDQSYATTPSPSPIINRSEPSWTRLSSPTPATTPIRSSMKPNKDEEEATNGTTTLKKLEAELEKTKAELRLLKERGSETEVALATLNAELHKTMSKLAQAEAAAAGKAAAATKTVRFEIDREKKGEIIMREEEEKKREQNRRRMEDSRTLAYILSPLGENDHLFGTKKHRKKTMKQKPIIPLVGEFFFFKRKGASTKSP